MALELEQAPIVKKSFVANVGDNSITVPRWVIVLFFGLLLNLVGVIFSAGVVWSKVSSLEERFNRFEVNFVYSRVQQK